MTFRLVFHFIELVPINFIIFVWKELKRWVDQTVTYVSLLFITSCWIAIVPIYLFKISFNQLMRWSIDRLVSIYFQYKVFNIKISFGRCMKFPPPPKFNDKRRLSYSYELKKCARIKVYMPTCVVTSEYEITDLLSLPIPSPVCDTANTFP